MSELLQKRLASRGSKRAETGDIKPRQREAMAVGFGFLSAFFVVYCSRPEEWIFFLRYVPVAKIAAGGAILALIFAGQTGRRLKDLPREAWYLLGLIVVLFVSSVFSPLYRSGALFHTLEFSKIFVIFVLVFMLVTDLQRLRRIVFIQSASVMLVTAISILKGYNRPRLEGVIGGIYFNPNDLAFAIVLSIPFCVAFLVTGKGVLRKLFWAVGTMVMLAALFLTASRAGFIVLVISGTVCLWHFGVRGRRPYLILLTLCLSVVLMLTAGKKLVQRFEAIPEQTQGDSAYGSYEARKYLMIRALEGIEHYPILGIGPNNFMSYSGNWREVHMTYLEIAVEGGIPSLILYLLVFWRGFRNLARLRKRKDLPPDYDTFGSAVHASLVGFAVGALFGPEAYHFFPYFAVAYTSAMMAMIKEHDLEVPPGTATSEPRSRVMSIYADRKGQSALTVPR